MSPAITELAQSLRLARLVDRLDEGEWDSAWDILAALESYLADRFDEVSLRDKLAVATLRREMHLLAKEAA